MIDDNTFTGTIPVLNNASDMSIFTAGHNLLTGNLLPHGFYNSIEIIDVSNNMLSGAVPMELLVLPNLEIFSAGVNCMTAQFTELICSADALQILILDGLHSSSSCRSALPTRIFDIIYVPSQSISSIPPCIYSLPSLTNLHLSGNGITGTLPTDATLNYGFRELIISTGLSYQKLFKITTGEYSI